MGTGREGDQQLPVPNEHPFVQDLMQASLDAAAEEDPEYAEDIAHLKVALEERRALGERRYKVAGLQPHNGRDMLRDMFEEVLDGAVYGWALAVETDDDGYKDTCSGLLAEALYLHKRMRARDAGQ